MKIFFIFVKKFRDSFQKLKKKLKPRVKFPKTQGKNPKLKQETKTLGGMPFKFEKLKKITNFFKKKLWGGPKNAIS